MHECIVINYMPTFCLKPRKSCPHMHRVWWQVRKEMTKQSGFCRCFVCLAQFSLFVTEYSEYVQQPPNTKSSHRLKKFSNLNTLVPTPGTRRARLPQILKRRLNTWIASQISWVFSAIHGSRETNI